MHQRGPGKGGVLAIEIADERQIHRRLAGTIEINAHAPFLGSGGPDAPDTARPLHLGHHKLVPLLANDAVPITVGIPGDILPGRAVVTALPVITRPLGALL